jgi:hypothetical protein
MGDGGAKIRGRFRLVAAAKVALSGLTPVAARPESTAILPVIGGRVDRSLGSIPSGTNVPAKAFALSSLRFQSKKHLLALPA